MKHAARIEAVKTLGPLGEWAAGHIVALKQEINDHANALVREKQRAADAERVTRDQAREIERLNRRIRALEAGVIDAQAA